MERSRNDFINLPYSEITVRYLNDSYDQEMVSMGQYGIMGYKNTSVLPYYIFAFSESYEAIGWNLYLKQNPAGIHVLPNGYINSEIKVGMTYNELKNKLHFEGVQNDADEFGWRVWVRIDGVLWGISFDLPKAKADELSAKTAELAPTIDDPRPKFDVSDVNPKSSRAFYLRDLQNWNP